MPTDDWRSFPCPGSAPRWRYLPGGEIEIEGEGVRTRAWPSQVDQWKPLIIEAASREGLSSAWVAAIMAIESGGRPGLCARLPDGTCSQREGAGLMAILPSTASVLAGRKVTSEELLSDHALSIQLGAKYLRQNLANPKTGGNYLGGDYVYAAVSYNAGSVRCGVANVWRPEGSGLPPMPCPPTSWGIKQGCVESPPGSGKINVADYPRKAIEFVNAALERNFGRDELPLPGEPPAPVPPLDRATATGARGSYVGVFAAAAVVGFLAVDLLRKHQVIT